MKTLTKKPVKNNTHKSSISTTKTRLAIAVMAATLSFPALANQDNSHDVKLLQARFDARSVVQVEAGDFHFKPGQVAPIHTHTAPAVGYVVKGEIIYQVEGEKQIILREGDAFYEPDGPRILRFDNASATEEAIFVDFNLEQEGEPFIVFEKPLTEAIDRGTLPTVKLDGQQVSTVDIYERKLNPAESSILKTGEPALGIVAQGVVLIREQGKPEQRVVAGSTFALTEGGANTTITNASSEVPAKVITFRVL